MGLWGKWRGWVGLAVLLSPFLLIHHISIHRVVGQEPATVHPGDVQLDSSRIYVFVDKTGFGHQHGIEAKLLRSTLILGATENAGELVFDMNSFDADTDRARKYVGLTGSTDRDTRVAVNENMKGSDVLDTRRYPTAKYVVESAKSTGKQSRRGLPIYELSGRFTLHGTERPLSFSVEVEQIRGWLHVRGAFNIQQTNYGMKPYSKAFGAVGVTDNLKIYGDIYVAPSSSVSLNDIPQAEKVGTP